MRTEAKEVSWTEFQLTLWGEDQLSNVWDEVFFQIRGELVWL